MMRPPPVEDNADSFTMRKPKPSKKEESLAENEPIEEEEDPEEDPVGKLTEDEEAKEE